MTRIAVNRDSSAIEKISAEEVAWRIRDEFLEKLQTLGYLPLKPTEFVLTHQSEDASFAEIEQTIADVQRVSQENGTFNPELEVTIQNLRADLEKAKLSSKATQLLDQQNQSSNQEGSTND